MKFWIFYINLQSLFEFSIYSWKKYFLPHFDYLMMSKKSFFFLNFWNIWAYFHTRHVQDVWKQIFTQENASNYFKSSRRLNGKVWGITWSLGIFLVRVEFIMIFFSAPYLNLVLVNFFFVLNSSSIKWVTCWMNESIKLLSNRK